MADEAITVEASVPQVEVAPTDANAVVDTASNDIVAEEAKADDEAKDKPEENDATENTILKTTRKAHHDKRKNNKFDPSILPVTDDAGQIRGQV